MNSYLDSLSIGGDPRVFNQFLAIKEEFDKRFHPARPDINWQYIHELCISLFNQNGVDLQTASWFVICRQNQTGLDGLNEGLYLIHKILTQHWQILWPVQTNTRINILSFLSQQLVSGIRGNSFVYSDLSILYQIEELLKSINHHLQTLEIKHLVQFDYLENLIITQTRQLENADTLDSNFNSPELSSTINKENELPPQIIDTTLSTSSISHNTNESIALPKTYISSSISLQSPIKKTYRQELWRGILIGTLISSLFFFILFYFWLSELKNNNLIDAFPYIPTINAHAGSLIEQQTANGKNITKTLNAEQIDVIQKRLDELALLSPTWAQSYGLEVISYLNEQYEDNPELLSFTQLWKNNLKINATTDEQLNQWSKGMTELDGLSQRLDSLDGNSKNYITGSELKSIIFKARQHFNQAKPLEEELRLLEKQPTQNTISDYEYQQIDNHFKQLLNRYSLLRSK
ncbi:type VI secretion system ImpA family N-terminal domain-containing protein [Proteus alimentorum]|uniref:Type VI secretion system ImpA family N-terminal domain-containing protein n=1 Tax=Proteus alimentorum TaxID=1973495 RepID=A0ABS0IXX3_9GAMM|nr:VasL domain-containing protein [Proteus alimentorum]MBG2876491.1 type VI secretion system ImpA family N-terminal domain-containing protein [Proteus alimentorum]MBG2880546.1 type VI secretion system ImpA family N-terminal domain-containing protein [Proteus alimentorum]